MRIGIDCGHTLVGSDTGAMGNGLKEQEVTRDIGKRVIAKLKAMGHTVIDCTIDNATSITNSLESRINKANSNNVDLFVSIHVNAAGGHGVEIYTYGGKKYTEAQNILNNIVALGYNNRGIKNGSGLYVIRNSNMKSMLIETFFIDSSDAIKYKAVGAEAFANAIVKGMTGKTIQSQPKQNSFIKIDGGGTISDNKPAINLIIKDYSNDINRAFAWVDSDKNASWAFDINPNPHNDNYVKLNKNVNKVINKRNDGYTFSPESNYVITVKGYNKEGRVVAETTLKLKTPTVDDTLYHVQVGAFKDKNNANRLRNALKIKGYEGFIKEE